MQKKKQLLLNVSWCRIAAIVLAVTLLSGQAFATSFTYNSFYQVTDNGNGANLSSQLLVTVYDELGAEAAFPAYNTVGLDVGAGNVLFAFTNNVGTPSSITEIYFDDGTILAQSAVHNSLGGFTNFTGGGASPGNLSSGGNVAPPFVATGAFSADVASGPTANGINAAADILGLEYSLQAGKILGDVQTAFGNGDLRLGFHIRSIGTPGGSDTYVSIPPNGEIPPPITPTPEPATMLLLGTGLVGVAGAVRRRKKNQS